MLCRFRILTIVPKKPVSKSMFTSDESSNPHWNLSKLSNDVFSWNAAITDYFRRGDTETARRLFDEMPERNLVTWNCMISGYIQNFKLSEAQTLFDIMPRRNVVSWTALLTGYSKSGMLGEARRLFDEMPERNVVCWNSMIGGYIRNRNIEKARDLFNKMPIRNFTSWAVMIGGYLQHGLVIKARELFDQAPDKATSICNALLSGYVELGYSEDAWNLFNEMSHRDLASWTTMITCYSRAGDIENAHALFDNMPTKCIEAYTVLIWGYMQRGDHGIAEKLFDEMPHQDIIAWNTMLGGYAQNGMLEDALRLFLRMPKRDIWSWNLILQCYVQKGDMVNAYKSFEQMPHKDETSWNTILSGYQSEEALVLFCRMILEGYRPDQGTFTIVITVCGFLSSLGWGKAVHLLSIKSGYEHDIRVTSSLITLYSKCGLIAEASELFERMLNRDTIAWNAIIVAQAYHGSALEALKLFPSMVKAGFKPDHVTFLALLSACAHHGLVDKGLKLYSSMQNDWKLIPKAEHYSSMVHLLGRSGRLVEAYEFVKQIPADVSTNAWETLLSACRVHGDLQLAELVAAKVLILKPSDGAVYVLLSNIYAAKGMWKDATRVRATMKGLGAKKEQGYSWIEIKGKLIAFVSSDRSHPQMGAIYRELETLSLITEETGW